MDRNTDEGQRGRLKCLQGRLWDVIDASQSRSIYTWAFSAAISIYTSKYILVDLNIHFPFHLFIWQLLGFGGYVYSPWGRSRYSNPGVSSKTKQPWLFPLIIAIFTALSIIFSLISLLHFPNVPTLTQLSILSFLPELLATFRKDRLTYSNISFLGPPLLAASCSGILFGEYRLLVNGMISWLLSIVFFTISRILYSVGISHYAEAVSDERRIDVMTYGSGFVISMVSIWILGWESAWRVYESVKLSHVPLLLVNVVASTTAIILGKSIYFPTHVAYYKRIGTSTSESYVLGIMAILLSTGIVGLLSTLSLRRAYTSNLQIFSFLVAILCVGLGPYLDIIRGPKRSGSEEYVLVSSAEEGESLDREHGQPSGDGSLINTPASSAQKNRSPKGGRAVFVTFILGFTWLVYLLSNFSEKLFPNPPKPAAILDLNYVHKTQHEIVISMYQEPLDHVKQLIKNIKKLADIQDAYVRIYTKDPDADVGHIKDKTGIHDITILDNVGREGETYLHHIINHWDDLARQTFFLQADVHNPREFWPRIQDYFDPVQTGMLSLGWSGNVCNCLECGDKWDMQDPTGLFPNLHGQISNETSCENVLLSYKGQFVVSAKRIRGVDKKVYEDLRDAFVNPDSWAHQEVYLRGRPDSMNAPQFGYQMERMWNLLFQCSDMDVAFKCPSLVSGARPGLGRIGGSKEDCQCFDPVPS